jgi:hypothetical protein
VTGPPARPPLHDLAATARQLGALRSVELRGFEVLGAWSASADAATEPAAAVLAAGHARHHAERAARLGACLPELPGLRPAEVTIPAGPAVAQVLDLLDAPDPVELLAGHYRCVLPRLASAYADLLVSVPPVTAAPVHRALDLAARELTDDWLAGERAVQTLLRDHGSVARAARRVERLEAALVAAGGFLADRSPP